VEDAKKFGVQGLLKDLIHVIDTLDLALTNTATVRELPAEQARQELENFHEAIRVLEKDLHKALGSHGVSRVVPPEGDDFNPNHHNALYTAPHDALPRNKVSKVHKAGWTLHSRVLRPAQVGVSTGPQKKD
jgi:molecular chaperone GrpE